MVQQSHPWSCIWRKTYFTIIHAPQCSLQHYLQKLRYGVDLNVYQRMNRWRRCGTYDNGILLNLKNEGNNVIFSNMDGHRDYHSGWSKSDRKIQISYHLCVESKKYKWIYLQNRLTNIENKHGYQRRKVGGRDQLWVFE